MLVPASLALALAPSSPRPVVPIGVNAIGVGSDGGCVIEDSTTAGDNNTTGRGQPSQQRPKITRPSALDTTLAAATGTGGRDDKGSNGSKGSPSKTQATGETAGMRLVG